MTIRPDVPIVEALKFFAPLDKPPAMTAANHGRATPTAEVLAARVRISLARMYLADLRNDAEFGRMVDAGGKNFPGSNRSSWIERVRRISTEIAGVLPNESVLLIQELEKLLARH